MIAEAPPGMLVSGQSLEITAARFNHCSSICRYRDGVLMAWYAGSRECADDQAVYLLFISKNGTSKPLQLMPGSGNPVVWSRDGEAYVLWSIFTDDGEISHAADRWKYCKNWMSRVVLEDDELKLAGEPTFITVKHLLGRCNPAYYDGQLYLPLYDEVNRRGIIIAGNGLSYRNAGLVGDGMIQPTVWTDGDKLCTLSRNFKTGQLRARYSESSNGGKKWSVPTPTLIQNNNASLHALNWGGHVLLLWNRTDLIRRVNLTLGVLSRGGLIDAIPLFTVSKYGGYPSMCEDSDGNLCVSYTNFEGVIAYHVYDRHKLLTAIDIVGDRGGDLAGGAVGASGDPKTQAAGVL
jgi:hypothetical protein